MSKRPLAAILVVLNASLFGVVAACNEGGKPPVGPVVIPASFADGGADAARLARSGAQIDHADASAGVDASPDFYARDFGCRSVLCDDAVRWQLVNLPCVGQNRIDSGRADGHSRLADFYVATLRDCRDMAVVNSA